jgi:putative ABC transport system permease protein
MTSPTSKIFRDFWQERTRTVLVVLAVALGLAGFSAVLATYAILDRELDNGYRATNPASATLRTDAVDDNLLREVRSGHGVADAQARRVLSGRLRTPSGEWRGLTLFVVQNYANIRISMLNREKGAWPPGPGEILIERDAFSVARVRIGDTVTVRTPRGAERTLRVTGGVHDVGQAQARMENVVYGYITLETLALLGEEPFLDQLQILAAGNRFDEKHVQKVAEGVKTFLESRGHPVRRVDVPKPGRHPHADIMGLLLRGMAVFGFGVLLLSGILVINLIAALMAAQVRQIGVMKTVGGTRRQIARIYLGQALLIGAAAVVVALPGGVAGSRLFASAMAVFLNFDLTSFAIPAWVFLSVGAVGLVVPLLAAAWPVWRGTGITVARALADAGTGGSSFGASGFDRMLAGIGGAARPVLLAVRNGFRRRTRLVLTVSTLAAGGIFFLSALNTRASMISTLDALFRGKKFDLTVSLSGIQRMETIGRAVGKTPGLRAFEGWITTEGSLASANAAPPAAMHGGGGGPHGGGGLGPDRFVAIALPAGTTMQRFDLVAGRGLVAGDTNAIVVNEALAAKSPEMRVGKTVQLSLGHGSLPWRIAGIVREPFSPPVGYVPKGYVDELGGLQGMTNSLRVAVDPSETDRKSIERIKVALERNLEAEGVRVVGTLSKADSRFGFDQHMVMIYVSLIVISAVIAGVGGLGLMTTMSLNVLERRREMGVLRAIGATPTAVWVIVVAEGAVTGALSWAVAAAAAWPVSRAIGNLLTGLFFKTGLDFSFEPMGLAVWAAVSLLLGAVASFLPAWHASQRPVREALGYE